MDVAADGGFDKRAYYDAIAADYAAHVVSPYALGVEMPLQRDIESWFAKAADKSFVADFGCGPGQSLAMLAGRGARTLGLDYSQGMLATARGRLLAQGLVSAESLRSFDAAAAAAHLLSPNVDETMLVQGDLHELGWLRGHVDLAIASNSLTDESLAASEHMFAGVAESLCEGGELLALLPSLDATHYVMDLHIAARGSVPAELGQVDHEGVYICDGLRQKFWGPEELRALCRRLGLEPLALTPIHFTWEAMSEAGWGYFPNEAPMWDWYLRARRVAPG